MKKYIETKQIEAEPMTLGDFVQETGRNPYGKDIENHKETEKGYRVKYEDGYESWSPAKAFEKSYKCADTFLDRLHIEMKDLYDRLDKLVAFIDSGKMDEVVTDNYQKFLLRLQQVVMGNYVKTLECHFYYNLLCDELSQFVNEHLVCDATVRQEAKQYIYNNLKRLYVPGIGILPFPEMEL